MAKSRVRAVMSARMRERLAGRSVPRKLSPADISAVRKRVAAGESRGSVAIDYDVSTVCIAYHCRDLLKTNPGRERTIPRDRVASLVAQGLSDATIAARLGCSAVGVLYIRRAANTAGRA